MSDKYGYIGIETLLNFCENSKDHAVTPNDFMHMNRVQIPERKKGKWIPQDMNKSYGMISTVVYYYPKCSVCGWSADNTNFCPNCGTDMRGEQIG